MLWQGLWNALRAGFPCQPFSLAGVSKKLSLGKKHGFEGKEQGNLFFPLVDIIDYHRPTAFVLENVKNLTPIRGCQVLSSNWRSNRRTLVNELDRSRCPAG